MVTTDDISILRRRLEAALDKVAALVALDQAFLPIYERLEQELDLLSSKEGVLERARARVARQSATR